MKKYKILITGSEGAIGKTIAPFLIEKGHFVRGFDLRKSQYLDNYLVGDIKDVKSLQDAMESIDTLIHLAAEPNDCDFLTRLLPANIIAIYNLFECAKMKSLRRIILASSMQVYNGFFKTKEKISLLNASQIAPLNHYAVTKIFAENMGQMYALRYKMSVICARIGWFVRNKEEFTRIKSSKMWQDSYLSYQDASLFFQKAVEAENIDFQILNAVSKPKYSELYDLKTAENSIGYIPEHTFPDGLPADFLS